MWLSAPMAGDSPPPAAPGARAKSPSGTRRSGTASQIVRAVFDSCLVQQGAASACLVTPVFEKVLVVLLAQRLDAYDNLPFDATAETGEGVAAPSSKAPFSIVNNRHVREGQGF